MEVVLEALLVERDVGQLEEVVLEVVQVPLHGLLVERRAGIRRAEVHHARPLDLEPWQQVEHARVDVDHRRREDAALRGARGGERLEEREVAEVLGQPDAEALVRGVDLGDRQADAAERAQEREEGAVLVGLGPVGADHGRRVGAGQTEVEALRPVGRQARDAVRGPAEGLGEERDDRVLHGGSIPDGGDVE